MSFKEWIILRVSESLLLIRVFVAYIVALFCPLKKSLWLISERGREARDNGYFFYKWIKQHHPEIPVKYIISKTSNDYSRIKPEDVVEFNSFQHLLYLWRAKYLISTHVMGFTPNHVFFTKLDTILHLFRHKKIIFLQHGIIKDRLEGLFHGNINVNLFVTGSNIEYHYVNETFGFPEGIVQYTGLCRYDGLYKFETKRQILIMPTFRMYINKDSFDTSDYYNAYKDLLTNADFHSIIEKNDLQVVFYPHYEFQSKISLFKSLPITDRIIIADMKYDVQELLKESLLLITDYSSVFFDMMYMNKPVIFYQFDVNQYRKSHYKEGYLNYQDVGPVTCNISALLSTLENYISTGFQVGEYQKYYNKTFLKRDTNNCRRVYEAVLNS